MLIHLNRSYTPIKILIAGMIIFCCLFHANIVMAAANLTIFPSKLILSKSDRSGSLSLVNRGDRTGLYEIFWIDNVMNDSGSLKRFEDNDGRSEYSLQPFARYSPRRIQLKPGERQVIKIAIRGRKAEEKEYFSHISVRTLSENLESTEEKLNDLEENQAALFSVITHKVISLPIIWRNTSDMPAGTIIDIKENNDNDSLSFTIERKSKTSLRGKLHVLDEKNKPIIRPRHVAIYANLKQRIVETQLENSTVTALKGKKIYVKLIDEDDEKNVIFEDSFSM